MIDPLVLKLNHYAVLSDEERRVLADAITRVIDLDKQRDIKREDEDPRYVHLILEGWACRYKTLPDGNEHIMGFLLPGDLCDVHVTILKRMDHSIRALTPTRVACIPHEKIHAIYENYSRLARALFWSTLVDEAVLREWLVNQGSRSAAVRIAHLYCEVLVRSRAVGLTRDTSFFMPLTQEELGDTTGLTKVHVNRSIRLLREEGLIDSRGKSVTILDWERMQAFAEFDPKYLHMPLAIPRTRSEELGG